MYIKFGEGFKIFDDGTITDLTDQACVYLEPIDSTFNVIVESAEKGADLAFKAAVKSLLLRSEEVPQYIPWERLEEYMRRYRLGYTLRMLSVPDLSVKMIVH
jgi:hypothetical protein